MTKQPNFSSLRKCRQVLKDGVSHYSRLSKRLSSDLLESLEALLKQLSAAIESKNIDQAQPVALQLHQFLAHHGKKTAWEHTKELVIAILLALVLAAFVRQMWFELYEIPTGSMRPTFREADNVLVMKDAFGINTPFQTSHLLFDPELVKRGAIVVITGDKLDLPDVDTVYFGLFPGKRRYVKRMVAKDGDSIYFYGGRIFGLDKEGNQIQEFGSLEHIPFITFEGKIEQTRAQNERTFFLRHMNIPIGKIQLNSGKILSGQVITPDGWKKEMINERSHNYPEAFFEFWGIGNYAISRLIEPKDLPLEGIGYSRADAPLYLELRHHPTLGKAGNNFLKTRKSYLPLSEESVEQIKSALYTARFFIRDGKAYRYSPEGPDLSQGGIFLGKAIPDGCYEFYNGIAYEIGLGSIAKQLDLSHPLYPHSNKELIRLYNFGINLYQDDFTTRYGYFRDGNFYTLGEQIVEKDDPFLTFFIETEKTRASRIRDYIPFLDQGAPSAEKIREFGLKIPEGHYLLLGDNHAMSNDSRFFGAVPQANLQGSPILLFWPPGERWGAPDQPSIPMQRLPNIIVLVAATAISCACVWYFRRRHNRTLERLHLK